MFKIYNTEELIQILTDERQACLNGQRLNLIAPPSGINPLIDKFLKLEGIQKFTAYHDFRATVHNYQREFLVSGIIWRLITLKGKTFLYPQVHDQLIALPSDRSVLKAAKDDILAFWQEMTADMDFYLSVNHGKDYRPIVHSDIDRVVARTEWASLFKHRNESFLEILLQLGWGKPEEAEYNRGWPNSGSEYIHAVLPGQKPIC